MIDRIVASLPRWARTPVEVLIAAAEAFGEDRAPRMSAAIAYRTVFALAPLLMIVVAVVGAFLGSRTEAQAAILDTVESVAGADVASILSGVMTSASASANTAALIGVALLLWTASSLFLEVQHALNDVFGVPTERVAGIVPTIRLRGIAFLWALGLGGLLILVWGLNAAWRYLGGLLPESMTGLHRVLVVLSPLISLILLPLVFALVLQTMTAIRVPWRAIWVGGLFTSAVFVVAAFGVGLYFELFSGPSALGFTGSLVVVIFLAYFFSSVFLFGAEVAKVYAARLGEPATPKPEGLPEDPLVLVAAPATGLSRTAFMAFLAGLAVAWRRRGR